jgi:hypothetical protein
MDPFNFIEEHRIPLIFLGIFVAGLLMNSYVNLCCGRGEMSRDDFLSGIEGKHVIPLEEEHEFFSHGLVQSLLHTLFLLMLMLPLLIVSAAISGISLQVFAKALSVLFTTAFLCRMFGFLMYLWCRNWSTVGYLLTRVFFIVFIFVTGFVPGFPNPILLIYSFHSGEQILIRVPMSAYSLYMIIVTAAILLLTLSNTALLRRNIHREKST